MWLKCFSVLAVAPLSAQMLWTPQHYWKQDSAYAGEQSCAACHAEIYRKQDASHHARSLRPTVEISEINSRLPFTMDDRSSGAKLTLSRGAGDSIALAAKSANAEDLMTLEWAFGSGTKGITPVGRLSNGSYAESRVSYYAEMQSFDFTTGATKFTPQSNSESLGRPLRKEDFLQCLGCHTTGTGPDNPAPARNNMGVRCERCHGPGAEHIRAMTAGSASKQIFQPSTLDGFKQAQFCGVCHGAPPQDTDFQTIRFIQESPNSVRFPSQRLVLSRCFDETDNGLRCTTCHDPHTDVAAQRAALEKTCVGCHHAGARPRAEVCPVRKEGCPSCHMPQQRVMAHSLFTDHWIRIVRRPAGVK
jgi:hypothetical protein